MCLDHYKPMEVTLSLTVTRVIGSLFGATLAMVYMLRYDLVSNTVALLVRPTCTSSPSCRSLYKLNWQYARRACSHIQNQL